MAPRSKFAIPDGGDDLIAWLDKRRSTSSSRQMDLRMRLNLAYMLGHQWVMWDPVGKRLKRGTMSTSVEDPTTPIQIQVNKIGGIVERTISKLTKSAPSPECRPITDDEDDVSAAKVATRILSHEFDRLAWEDILTRLYFWVVPIGYAYLYAHWDPDEGPEIPDPTGLDDSPVHEGNVKLDIVPPFEMLFDPNARMWHDARWCIRSQSMTKEAVYEQFGKEPEGAEYGRSLADDVYAMGSALDRPATGKSDDEHIVVNQFWLRPGGRNRPEGMVCTWAGKTFLDPVKPFPYDHGRLPFVQFDFLPGQGTVEGRTWVDDLIEMQKDYNDARSREAHLRRVLTPKVVAPIGSFDPSRMSSRAEYLLYNPVGQPPTVHVPDSGWMAQHEAAMQRADMEMGERAGQAEVSQGKAPAGAPAAAILALQEADDTKLAVSAKLLAKGTKETGWQVLQLVRQFWDEERTVRTWSEDTNRIEVGRYTGAEVGRQLDIRVTTESTLPRSKASRAQLATELWTAGIINDPRYYLRLLDLPGTDFLREQMNVDAQQQQREIDRMWISGEPEEIHAWDNHQIHAAEIDNFRKSITYEKGTPEQRAIIDAHADAHYQMLGMATAPPTAVGGAEDFVQGQGAPQESLGGMAAGGPEMMGMAPPPGGGPAPSEAAHPGIGGPGEPGRVPGIDPDQQAEQMGM